MLNVLTMLVFILLSNIYFTFSKINYIKNKKKTKFSYLLLYLIMKISWIIYLNKFYQEKNNLFVEANLKT